MPDCRSYIQLKPNSGHAYDYYPLFTATILWVHYTTTIITTNTVYRYSIILHDGSKNFYIIHNIPPHIIYVECTRVYWPYLH